MSESCKTCRFSANMPDDARVCRRFPPPLVAIVTGDGPGLFGSGSTGTRVQAQMTPVADEWWCGEYKERVE